MTNQKRLTATFEKSFKMNGLEELVQGNSVRWMRTGRRKIPSGENVANQLGDGGDLLGDGENVAYQQPEQAMLSPEMVMAEFDRQVGSIHHPI